MTPLQTMRAVAPRRLKQSNLIEPILREARFNLAPENFRARNSVAQENFQSTRLPTAQFYGQIFPP
jgi:hypothetical protein